jgi:hypothetical protein
MCTFCSQYALSGAPLWAPLARLTAPRHGLPPVWTRCPQLSLCYNHGPLQNVFSWQQWISCFKMPVCSLGTFHNSFP